MKMQIIGLEASSGTSGKTGKAYEIGQIHAIARLAPPLGAGNTAKGQMGTTYRCGVELINSISHNTLPFMAEADVQDVMRFGKREQEVFGVVPESQGLVKPKP
jgi:hypothetical protein